MRDNSKRLSAVQDTAAVASVGDSALGLEFPVPTELVDLPSRGKHYSAGHPLHEQETIEIRFMTAKDEDILASPSLLKKGLAIDRFLQNVVVDKRINIASLLSGDKSAIIVASRINGFGAEYTTSMTCPSCASSTQASFNLDEIKTYLGDDYQDYEISETDIGTHTITLPKSRFEVEVRLLTGKDATALLSPPKGSTSSPGETSLTDLIKRIVTSINGVTDRKLLDRAIDVMPARDSRYLRAAYIRVIPGLDMTQEFCCPSCGLEKEVDIPLTVDFFWSNK